jgi:hypothetical protein
MQGLEGLADYATAMLSFIFYLPAILLWLATILVGAALGWKTLRLGGTSAIRREETCACARLNRCQFASCTGDGWRNIPISLITERF